MTFEWIKDLPWKRILGFLLFLFRRRPWALVLSIVLFIISILLGRWYWQRATQYYNLINKTLQAELESTAQKFKGLEAFILSNLKQDLDENLKKAQFDPNFIQNCRLLKRAVERFKLAPLTSPQLKVAPGKNGGKILTDDFTPGFLFLPVCILRTPFGLSDLDILTSTKARDKKIQDSLIVKAIANDKYLWMEVAFAQQLAETLQGFTSSKIVRGEINTNAAEHLEVFPVQVSLIAKNGVARIFSRIQHNPSDYYGDQLPATTFLPSQSAFWPAFEQNKFGEVKDFVPKEGQTLGEYFYISRPHLDAGGHGIVLTLARGFLMADTLQAVICFDLRIVNNKSVYPALGELIDNFGGIKIEVNCTINNSVNVDCQSSEENKSSTFAIQGDLLEKTWAWITSRKRDEIKQELMDNMNRVIQSKVGSYNRAEVCGNIQLLHSPSSKDVHEEVLQVSVPIGELSYDTRSQIMSFLLFSIDLTAYRQRTSYLALGAAMALASMVLILASSWWGASRESLKHQKVIELVSDILSKLPNIPWVRLDAHNKICDLSQSFCEKLGYPFTEEVKQKLTEIEFRKLFVDKNDARRYQKAQEASKKTGKMGSFSLNIRKQGGGSVAVKVVSLEIASVEGGNSHDTFCMLLDRDFDVREIRRKPDPLILQ